PSASFGGFGGAIDNLGDLTLSNTYLVLNKSRYGGGLAVGQAATTPVTRLETDYLVQNHAVYSGGGVYASTTTTATAVLTITNSVWHDLALNCDATGDIPTSLGGNFSSDLSCGLGPVSGDVQGLGLDPHLSSLQFSLINLSQYFAPLPGSPLINTATFPC